MHWRHVAFLLRFDAFGNARVETERGDDLLAVFELEQLLNRIAVTRRCGHIDDATRIRDAEIAEEHHRRSRAAGNGSKD